MKFYILSLIMFNSISPVCVMFIYLFINSKECDLVQIFHSWLLQNVFSIQKQPFTVSSHKIWKAL